MKKFFSLVLALVMALSLTTMAWGAATELPAADANGVITLTENVTLTFTGNHGIALADGTVIDGAGYTLTLEGNVGSYSSNAAIYNLNAGANVQVKDLVIDNNLISGYVFSFTDATLDNVDITGGNGLVVMTAGAAGDEIVVKNCEFTGFTGTAILTDSAPATPVSIEDSAFIGANTSAIAVIMRSSDSSSVGSTYSAKLNLYAAGTAENVVGNTFNARVKVYNDDETLTGNSFDADGYIELDDADFDVDASGNYWGGGAPTAAQLGGATATTYYTTAVGGALGGLTGVASAPASAAKGAYLTANMTSLSVYPGLDLDTYTYSLEHYTSGNAAAKSFDQKAIWSTHKVTGAKVIEAVFVVAASAESADYAFVNGTQITYLSDVAAYTGTVTALPTVDAKDAAKCGEMFVGGDYAAYTDANGKLYVEKAGGTVYNAGGKYVELDEVTVAGGDMVPCIVDNLQANPANYVDYVLYVIGHEYGYDTKTVAGKTTVTAVFCKECKASFEFVEGTEAKAIAKFGAGNYNTVAAKLFVAKTAGAAVGGTTAGDKVQSAETFDAGIAMYVGMSVMAAAGSAVVLKKRED